MLLAIKIIGALVAAGVGILGLFSDVAYNKQTHRITRLGVLFVLLIIGGSSLSFTADFMKDLDDRAQTRAQLDAINRAVYPFSDLRFGFVFEANMKDPALTGFARNLKSVAEAASRPHSINWQWESVGRDNRGRNLSFWADSKEAMTHLFPSGEEQAFYSIFDVSETLGVFSGNSRPPATASRFNQDAIYESGCCNQTISAYGGGNYVDDKRQALIVYYPSSRKCYIWMHVYDLARGAPLRPTSPSLAGLADLAGKWLAVVVQPSDKVPFSLPLRLDELDLQIGKQRTTISFPSPGTPADYSSKVYSRLEPADFNTLISEFTPAN